MATDVKQMQTVKMNWLIGWLIAFLGFPPGGTLALALIGKMETPIEALIGGAAAGLIIGAAQYLALRRRLPVGVEWVAATVAGMAVGLGASVAISGAGTDLNTILMRAAVNGLALGGAQWLVLRRHLGNASVVWLPVNVVMFVLAWFVTAQVIGQNVNEGFVVFGASGALTYQVLMGLVLGWLIRIQKPERH